MINRLQAVFDAAGSFFVKVTTGGYGLQLRSSNAFSDDVEHAQFIVGLLNSDRLDYCMRLMSNHFHSGYFPANKQYLRSLPIKYPEASDEHKAAHEIVESVGAITGAKPKLSSKRLSDRERRSLELEIENHERRINEAVLRLYGIDGIPT